MNKTVFLEVWRPKKLVLWDIAQSAHLQSGTCPCIFGIETTNSFLTQERDTVVGKNYLQVSDQTCNQN